MSTILALFCDLGVVFDLLNRDLLGLGSISSTMIASQKLTRRLLGVSLLINEVTLVLRALPLLLLLLLLFTSCLFLRMLVGVFSFA